MPLLQQPAGGYELPRAHVLFKPQGSNTWEIFGDVDSFVLNIETEEINRYAKNFGVRTKAATDVVQVDGSLEFTLMQWLDRARAMSVGSDLAYHAQTAETGSTITFENVAAGGVYDVGALDLSNVSIADDSGTPVDYTAGTHYELDEVAGLVRVIAMPETATPNMVVTFDSAEIADTDERQVMGIGATPSLKGSFLVRGVNAIGRKTLLRLHQVTVSPSGRPYIGGDDYEGLDFTGSVEADVSQPEAYKLGIEIGLG